MSLKILLVDDEPNILESVGGALKRSGYSVVIARGCRDALSACDETIDVAFLDVWLEDGDGVELLRQLRAKHTDIIYVMISGHSTISTAVEAIKLGAYDFLEKPLSLDKLEILLEHVKEMLALKAQRDSLLSLLEGEYRLVGESAAIQELRRTIARFAPEESPVMITGESGTGKELVARLIHQNSPRGKGAFVALNCAALPLELSEAELFGYEKGAFTGAGKAHPGHFRRATGGTLFLDEISEMSLPLQAKFLRVVESGKVMPLGGKVEYDTDVRLVAASNKDLKREIDRGGFRQDLFFRLNVLPIKVPPLSERSGDIRMLVEHFCRQYARRANKRLRLIARAGVACLEGLNYPGNVRELKNYVERIMILTEADPVGESEVKAVLRQAAAADFASFSSLKQATDGFEKDYILKAIKGAGGNLARTARSLGLERSHLYKKMKRLGIEIADQRQN